MQDSHSFALITGVEPVLINGTEPGCKVQILARATELCDYGTPAIFLFVAA
jgi:hypothetical protein